MQVLLKATRCTLTEAEQALIKEKIESLGKYYPRVIKARIEIERIVYHKEGTRYRAEANLQIPHKLIRIERQSMDWRKAFEKVKDHLKVVLSREKKKMIDKTRKKPTS